jgi:hypothetical protein
MTSMFTTNVYCVTKFLIQFFVVICAEVISPDKYTMVIGKAWFAGVC